MIGRPGGVALQIALAALLVAGIAIAILVVGVILVGGQTFADLMAEHGETPIRAGTCSSTRRLGRGRHDHRRCRGCQLVAASSALGLRCRCATWPRGPPDRGGDYGARIPREGPEEIVSLSDSFNQMAAALEEQERMRREFIANAAHELRTPLTNLQGYLEALRDGVIDADPATFESLLEESERLVRLSRSLDTLAAGDAGGAPATVDLDLARLIRSAVDLARPGMVSGLSSSASTSRPTCRLVAIRTSSPRCSRTCCRTRSATRRAGGRIEVRAERRPADILVSVTNTGRGSRARTCRTSSSASTGSRSHEIGHVAAPASAWPSSVSSSKPPAAASARSRVTGGRRSGSACRPDLQPFSRT